MKRLLILFAVLLPTGASALPGNYSLEAYTRNGGRPFAGYWSYYQRVYTVRQARYLHRATRRKHRHLRKYCGARFRMSDRNLSYIRAHRSRGHRVVIKRYLGYVRGKRRFLTICQL